MEGRAEWNDESDEEEDGEEGGVDGGEGLGGTGVNGEERFSTDSANTWLHVYGRFG
jgi:hypothetical protein